MRTRLFLWIICLAVVWQPFVMAEETPIVVFIGTNQYQAVNTEAAEAFGIQLMQYNLDAHRNLEKKLSEGLPQDRVEAERHDLCHGELQGVRRS